MQEVAQVHLNNAMNMLELSLEFINMMPISLFEQKEPGCVNSR
jgi:hypothetical protein